MTYDALDRLKTAVSLMWGGGTASYAYDALDNLTRVVVPGSRNHYYCYDGANLLTNVKTGGCTGTTVMGLGYDPQGNVSNKSGTLYDFDFGNRLRGVYTLAGATIETYRYDGLGRRVLAWAPGTGNVLSQYSQGGQLVYQHDERTSQRIDYLYLGGSLVASRTRPFGSSTVTIEYQHTDALGSPVVTSNTAGTPLRYDEYEPYGRRMNRANDNRPGHTAHVMDQNTALTYMQQRYYDPGIGMFLSVDPVTAYSNPVGHFHRYRYANNNPFRYTDPDGRCNEDINSLVGGLPCDYQQRNLNPAHVAADKVSEQDAALIVGTYATVASTVGPYAAVKTTLASAGRIERTVYRALCYIWLGNVCANTSLGKIERPDQPPREVAGDLARDVGRSERIGRGMAAERAERGRRTEHVDPTRASSGRSPSQDGPAGVVRVNGRIDSKRLEKPRTRDGDQ